MRWNGSAPSSQLVASARKGCGTTCKAKTCADSQKIQIVSSFSSCFLEMFVDIKRDLQACRGQRMASLHHKLQVSVSKLLKEANSRSGTEKTRHRPLQVEACPEPRNTQTDGAPDDITDITWLSNMIKSMSLMDEGFESPSLVVRQRKPFPVIMIPVHSCVYL